MVPQPRRGSTTSGRHLPCVLHHGGIPRRVHRPAHNCARLHVHQPRPIPPALRRPDIGDIASPHVIGGRHVQLTRQQMRRDLIAVSLSVLIGPRRLERCTATPALFINRRAFARPTCNPSSWSCLAMRRRPSLCHVSAASAVTRVQKAPSAASTAPLACRGRDSYNPRRLTSSTSHRTETGPMS